MRQEASKTMSTPANWTARETDITVKAYFETLKAQQNGNPVNRQALYNKLATRLSRRNPKAIEYRFHNIEAILVEENLPSLGLAPMANTSRLLRASVLANALGYTLARITRN